jgi:hypothetical protein
LAKQIKQYSIGWVVITSHSTESIIKIQSMVYRPINIAKHKYLIVAIIPSCYFACTFSFKARPSYSLELAVDNCIIKQERDQRTYSAEKH